MDSRRERNARFGCRKPVGATKTPPAKRVVLRQCGSTKALPYHSNLMSLVGEGLAPPENERLSFVITDDS